MGSPILCVLLMILYSNSCDILQAVDMAMSMFGFAPRRFTPTYFDIRTNGDTIWLPPEGHTYGYYHLKGKVVLCLSEAVCVKDIKLHFEGRQCINHVYSTTPQKEAPFHHQIWTFLRGTGKPTTVLRPDNYEFPFEICLPGKMPESIEGLDDCYIRYHLTAKIYGTGETAEVARDIHARRACPSVFIEDPETYDRTWPGKIIYSATIPSQTVSFGDEIRPTFRFVPLVKGLQVATMTCHLIETHRTTSTAGIAARSRPVAIGTCTPAQEGGVETVFGEGEWCSISCALRVPGSTRDCLHSASTTFLSVEHMLDVIVLLRNPDGHCSSVTVSFPVFIRFAPPDRSTRFMVGEYIRLAEDDPLPNYKGHVLDRKPEMEPSVTDVEGCYEGGLPPDYVPFEDLSRVPSYASQPA